MAKAKKNITIKMNWSAVARIAVGTILLTAMYAALKHNDESSNDDSDME
jgi:hypothetical protein